MISMWNKGDYSFADIAARVRLPMDVVAVYLAAQPGFPQLIPNGKGMRICGAQECGQEFMVVTKLQKYCSPRCRSRRMKRQQRGIPLDAPLQWDRRKRYSGISSADQRVLDEAKIEANKRGTTRDVVLAEWKFKPQRRAA